MSPDKYGDRVLILPEDDANRQLANGFRLYDAVAQHRVTVLPNAGGWPKVKSLLHKVHTAGLRKYPQRYVVLLVDFDSDKDRYNQLLEGVSADLVDQLFVVGVWSEPEDLKRQKLGTIEAVGRVLARECHENRRELWNHDLLIHNANELNRMTEKLRPILFPSK